MKHFLTRYSHLFSNIILDNRKRYSFLCMAVYILLGIVSLTMTIVNIVTGKGLLTYVTLVFTLLCGVNILLTLCSKKGEAISVNLVIVEVLAMLTYFVVSGEPEGFSAIWAGMVPTCGLLFFGEKKGSIMSGTLFLILVFFFWIPWGQSFLMYSYTQTFMMRFPLLYLAFFVVAFALNMLLKKTQDAYNLLYRHDILTGALNRVGFDEVTSKALESLHNGDNIGFLIADLDHFKRVNDTYGHDAGDCVLKEAVKIMSESSPYPVCRWGGEEFTVFFPDGRKAVETASKIYEAFRSHRWTLDSATIHQTVSIGVITAKFNQENTTISNLCIEADRCLYDAKNNGRDQMIFKSL